MLELDLSLVGWVHTIVCVVAMLAFVPVMIARKGSRRHRTFGRVYSLAYVAVCATSLGIYSQQRFWFPHWLAIGGLVVLVIGYLAAHLKPRGWRYIHLSAMLLSAYNLFGGAVNEAYLRIPPLRRLAGDNIMTSPLGYDSRARHARIRVPDWRLRGCLDCQPRSTRADRLSESFMTHSLQPTPRLRSQGV